MTKREKMIEILGGMSGIAWSPSARGVVADHLLANGVTIQQWIPAENPPEKEGSYLVCSKTGKVYTSHYYTEKKCSEWYTRKADWSHPNVTNWMPLPEPPKEAP